MIDTYGLYNFIFKINTIQFGSVQRWTLSFNLFSFDSSLSLPILVSFPSITFSKPSTTLNLFDWPSVSLTQTTNQHCSWLRPIHFTEKCCDHLQLSHYECLSFFLHLWFRFNSLRSSGIPWIHRNSMSQTSHSTSLTSFLDFLDCTEKRSR